MDSNTQSRERAELNEWVELKSQELGSIPMYTHSELGDIKTMQEWLTYFDNKFPWHKKPEHKETSCKLWGRFSYYLKQVEMINDEWEFV